MDIISKVLRRIKCSTNLKISFKVISEGKGRLVGGKTTIFVLVNQKRKSFTIQINVEKNFTELERYINNMIKSFYFQPTAGLIINGAFMFKLNLGVTWLASPSLSFFFPRNSS